MKTESHVIKFDLSEYGPMELAKIYKFLVTMGHNKEAKLVLEIADYNCGLTEFARLLVLVE